MKFTPWIRLGFVVVTALFLGVTTIFAQACDPTCGDIEDCQRKMAVCQKEWDSINKAVQPHAFTLKKMEADILAFQNKIKSIEVDVAKQAAAIAEGEKELGNLLVLVSRRAAALYRRTVSYNPLLPFLTSTNVGSVLRLFTYQQVVINEDKKAIAQTAVSVRDLESRKSTLEAQKKSLAALKDQTDARAVSVRKLVTEANAYQSKLSSIIASLSAKQQSFLAAKLSGLNLPTSLGAGPLYCTDDRKLDPGFSPAFAFFTYGIPHRVGMNQYGALGRAQAGQSAEDILRAYFDNIELKKDYNTGINIQVDGHGSYNIEEYVKHIYEIPESWPMEALKAQAVAARSYALSYTNNGAKSICTTQSCQVFKSDPKTGAWAQAVEATRGWVMLSGGTPVTAWFSSTDGGYTYASSDVGWSSKPWTKRTRDANGDINSFSDLQNKAYDRSSPCFYAAQGFRTQYGKSAWLKSDEVADIVNVVQLARKDSGTREHLYQPDKPNPAGTDTWSRDKVKEELRTRGGTPFSSVSSVSVSGVDFGVGRTTQITVSGDAGSISFEGAEFKDFFNLRAPANIQIVGPLFNIEKK
ncbi:SpoIID/LytB domain-containing protein [Candidatus Woesebacteria bacterium]|jgi:SpoIID/LytB domain protein|nr:SpoIID/LytB domain-containing protein [Candidatus Woesebacteria bacterium]